MRKWKVFIIVVLIMLIAGINESNAQCSICTKTAMQQGEKSAGGMNSGVIYLMLTPFAIVGYIGYRWWKTEKQIEGESNDAPKADL